ncbi:MAG: cytochrome c biogenesis protein ResB, partial [Planctomycetota bacterium]
MSAVTPASSSDFSSDQPSVGDVWKGIQAFLAPFASLKLTVVLFLFSIWLILVGTLAQAEMNMWEVMKQYFRSVFAWMEFKHLVPLSFFPNRPDWIRGGMYIPGGLMLGGLLALNLLAAHISRFKVQAKGSRLWTGLAVIALGAFLTTLVVLGGHNSSGLQGKPLLGWDQLWMLIRYALCVVWVGSVVLILVLDRKPLLRFVSLIVLSAILGVAAVYLLATGDTTRLGDSSLRILWQLIQGGAAGIILLVGCVMVFKKRGGIVLIHAGVGLLMLGELLVGVGAIEEQITLVEGQSTQFARDTREIEIAVIDRSPADHDHVTVIPAAYLKDGKSISHESLPFDIDVVEFLKNANLRPPKPNDVNPATAGAGLSLLADPARSSGGAEADQAVDIGAVYVKVTPKLAGADSQTYLLAQHFGDSDVLLRSRPAPVPETVTVGDKEYDLLLRFKRNYKPYTITLKDVSKDDYIGTSTPKDYSSWVSLTDSSRNFTRDKIRIWMNNPLRYAGETFYQSGYNNDGGEESTTLQVVTNRGWMIPYVACMLALVGLAYH